MKFTGRKWQDTSWLVTAGCLLLLLLCHAYTPQATPQAGRYQMIKFEENRISPIYLLDTATGEIFESNYSLDQPLTFQPWKWKKIVSSCDAATVRTKGKD